MAKHTKALSGPAKRKYFRDVLRAETEVSAEAAQRLSEKFDTEITHLRLRGHAALRAVAEAKPDKPRARSRPPTKPVAAAAAAQSAVITPAAPVSTASASAETFDPHAFSLIVVMSRLGADGLKAKLEAIVDPAHLRAIARAQHVAIDTSLDEPAALRLALVAGTAQRMADRRAAAS